jgi:hypothetical protein
MLAVTADAVRVAIADYIEAIRASMLRGLQSPSCTERV